MRYGRHVILTRHVILIQVISDSILILLLTLCARSSITLILLLSDDQPLHDLLLRDDLLHDRALPPVEEVRVVAPPCMVAMPCTQQVIGLVCHANRELLRVVEVLLVCQRGLMETAA